MGIFRKLNWFGPRHTSEEQENNVKIKFSYTDGRKPGREGEGRPLNIKLPVGMNVPPGSERTIDLGMSCDHALLGVPARILRSNSPVVFNAGEPIVVKLKNDTAETLLLEEGEVILKAYVLENQKVEIYDLMAP